MAIIKIIYYLLKKFSCIKFFWNKKKKKNLIFKKNIFIKFLRNKKLEKDIKLNKIL